LPESFDWPLFLIALALMALPVVITARQMWKQSIVFQNAQSEELS
jgi:hypothetical protein